MDSEEILWTGHPSNWHYAWAWVIGVLLAVVLIGFFVILWILVDRSRITYTVTATKVIREAGLWAKTSDEVRIRDIRSIAMRKGGFLGLAGVGDLEFSSAAVADGAIAFRSVRGVEAVRDLVRRLQVD
jgi:uncharacterized membrane protein YdbT with pleckstrin-like domain